MLAFDNFKVFYFIFYIFCAISGIHFVPFYYKTQQSL